MLTAPADLAEAELISVLHDAWSLTAADITYRPVGWGSHHWEVVDTQGFRWFMTVDEYTGQLHASLKTAVALRDNGYAFAVAPVAAHDGEPLARNTMLTATGWRLIDWDTALIAPPERDLWLLDPGDGSLLDIYRDITGTEPHPSTVELYRKRWQITDIAIELSRFRQPRLGTEENAKSWEILRQQLP